MGEKEFRKSMAIFPIGTVMKLTDLSARQIRYYEEQELIAPERNKGNRRLYSLNHVDCLLEIKDYLQDGLNIAGIKHMYQLIDESEKKSTNMMEKNLTDKEIRRIFHDEFIKQSGLDPLNPFNTSSLRL